MKKYLRFLPLTLLISAIVVIPTVFANITVGNVPFKNQTSVGGKPLYYKFVNISQEQTDGTYDLGVLVDLFEQDNSIDSGSDDIYENINVTFSGSAIGGLGIETATDTYIYKSGTKYVTKTELESLEGAQSAADLRDKLFGTFYAYELFSTRDDTKPQSVNPGNYVIKLQFNNTMIDTFSICLPTFTSSIGKSVGNITCSGANNSSTPPNTNNPPQTGGNGNTNNQTNPPAVSLNSCNLFKGTVSAYREPTPDSGIDTASRVAGIKDVPAGSTDQTRLFTYGLEDTPRHIIGSERDKSFDTHLALVRNETIPKIDRKDAPYNFEIGFSTVNDTTNFKWSPLGQGTMGTTNVDNLISYSIRVSDLQPGTKYWYTVRDNQYNTVLATNYFTTTGVYVAPTNIQQSDCYIGAGNPQQSSGNTNNSTPSTPAGNTNTTSNPPPTTNNTGNGTSIPSGNTPPAGSTAVDPQLNPSLQSLTSCDNNTEDCYTLLEALPQKQADGTYKYIKSFNTSATGSDQGIGGFLNFIFQIAIGIAGVIGVVMLTIFGFQYAAQDKNINTLAELRNKITNVIFGILLLLGIFIILRTINPDLLIVEPEIPDVTLTYDQLSGEGGPKTGTASNISIPGATQNSAGRTDVTSIKTSLNKWDALLSKYAKKYGVDCTLLKAVMVQESKGQPNADSGEAAGLMQVRYKQPTNNFGSIPSSKWYDPETNISVGTQVFKDFLKPKDPCLPGKSWSRYSGCSNTNINYSIAAYNGGYRANGAACAYTYHPAI
jgi:hypothetical protein